MTMTERVAHVGPEFVASERVGEFPGWVPVAARNYLAHTEGGHSIRSLAREAQVHPSTILRRVRRVESLRDDPLVDSALRHLSVDIPAAEDKDRDEVLANESVPVLRRLAEAGSVLAVARDMEKGVVVREGNDGEPTRLAVVDRRLAEAMALRDWIACVAPDARIRRYRITPSGRQVLRRRMEEARPAGLAEAPASFIGIRAEEAICDESRLRHMRSSLPESPLAALARRRDGEGRPFLSRELVAAGERLREDFELVQGVRDGAVDWDQWLERLPGHRFAERSSQVNGPEAARSRMERALSDLGPGLADVALRCCCLLEGLEQLEKRLGWSARSGKVVLRIALERLRQHYGDTAERSKSLIG
ncbi:DUF6456 domain-containing protein [Rubellimicrobium rubrum]